LVSFRLVCLSIAPIRGQWGNWWTLPRLAHGRPNGSIKNSRTVCITPPTIQGSILYTLQSTLHPNTYHNLHSDNHNKGRS
jgi:hypothetical protein